jgi:hypothetical protein
MKKSGPRRNYYGMRAEHDHTDCGTERQGGFALLITLLAVSLLALIGLYLALAATSEVRITDNFEGYVRARAAAQAGLNHARALLKGLRSDDLLLGPDGTHSSSPAYVTFARGYGYRMPLGWPEARTLNIQDPAGIFPVIPDDGIVNTGRRPEGNGMELIPGSGIDLVVPDPRGTGMLVAGRYFVKVSDNAGEASELAQDPADDPFLDGDGVIIVRSLGIARTLREEMKPGAQRNALALLEARFKRYATFDLDAALVVQGFGVEPSSASMFGGSQFLVQGGAVNPGIATIDAPPGNGALSAQQILSRLTKAQWGNVQGAGLAPSVRDASSQVSAHPDKRLLSDPSWVRRFVTQSVPQFADSIYTGSQSWIGTAPRSLGSYDPALPQTSPGQDPRVTYVNGDLFVDGNLEGGGLLVVTGKLSVNGRFRFCGLILAAGAGDFASGGLSSITGAVYVAGLADSGGIWTWGTAKLTLDGICHLTFDRDAIRMAISQIPPAQLGFREVTSIIDP